MTRWLARRDARIRVADSRIDPPHAARLHAAMPEVEIRTGASTVTYQKTGDKWMSGSKQMDSASVQALIDKLRDLSSIKFLETGGGSPVLEATVTSSDGKRVEKAVITKQGNSYYAKRENEPTVYELDSKVVEALQKAAGEVKENKGKA